jgi:hypothetical protein
MINQEKFIKERMISEVEDLYSAGFKRIAVGLIAQYIETLGAFLDKKPFKVPRQSAQRFHLALEQLFIPRYSFLNNNNFLYKQLRSNFTHLGIESQFLTFDFEGTDYNCHLLYKKKKTIFVTSRLLEDYLKACNLVIRMIEKGDLKMKKLA